jgi:hypothetical protein
MHGMRRQFICDVRKVAVQIADHRWTLLFYLVPMYSSFFRMRDDDDGYNTLTIPSLDPIIKTETVEGGGQAVKVFRSEDKSINPSS